jgi:hypothetical protein
LVVENEKHTGVRSGQVLYGPGYGGEYPVGRRQ